LTNSTPLIERAQNEDVTDDDIDPAAPPKRRTFTPEQKLAILAAYDEATGPGAKGAYLRQEGNQLTGAYQTPGSNLQRTCKR